MLELTLFEHLVRSPVLDLGQAAFLVAAVEFPEIDIAAQVARIDLLAADPAFDGKKTLGEIAAVLHEELGYIGNTIDYFNPNNSFLNVVLDSHVGIPITLAVLLIEVARRRGIDAAGVSFPGHFLVRGGNLLVDPFEGKICTRSRLRYLMEKATGRAMDPPQAALVPAKTNAIMARMLNNLRSIYTERGDEERLSAVVERMRILDEAQECKSPSTN
jgi:regulator of sirC expression with transglutaminase-like and TPR domain